MGLLQEAKYAAMNVLALPFGVHVLAKYEIEGMLGKHTIPNEAEMWLFNRVLPTIFGQEMHARTVTVVNKNGKRQEFKEVTSPDKAGESIIVYKTS